MKKLKVFTVIVALTFLFVFIGTAAAGTLEEIAQQYKITKERVRQIKERALTKLRYKARSKNLRIYLQ